MGYVYNPAAGLPLTAYHVTVRDMPCVPPSDPRDPDPPYQCIQNH